MSQGKEMQRSEGEGLRKWERIVAGVGGVGLAGLGAAATFLTTNQAGSAGLLLAGSVIAVMGLTGQSLRSIRIGDNEASFYERVGRRTVEEAREDLEGEGPSRPAVEVVESVAATSDVVPREVGEISRGRDAALLFEQQVDLALRQIDARVRADRTVDFVLGGLGIECKYRAAGRAPGPGAVQPGGNYYTRVAAAGLAGFDRLLILTNSQVAGELAEGLEVPVGPGPKVVKVWVAQWQPSDGEDRLRAIIQAAK